MSKDDEDKQLEEGIEGGGGRELRREEEAEDEEAKSQKVHPPLSKKSENNCPGHCWTAQKLAKPYFERGQVCYRAVLGESTKTDCT